MAAGSALISEFMPRLFLSEVLGYADSYVDSITTRRCSMKSLATRRWIHSTAAVLVLTLGAATWAKADAMVYATADNGTTNVFGTMDLTTGQFTQISATTPLFASLTAGTGGTLFGAAGNLNFNLYTMSTLGAPSQFGTVTAPTATPTIANGFLGLASEGASGFFADNVSGTTNPFTYTLEHISADGTSSSVVGTLGTSFGSFNSGNMAFGPNGALYFNAWTTTDVTTLYSVNTTTGLATAVGSGLGSTDPLALVTYGTTLYGIDTFAPTSPAIYTIDTTTGVATEIGTVSGLAAGYTLDTMASAVPEPGSRTLLGIGALVLVVFSRHAHRRPCRRS
jgi:hypothetical protein